MLLKIFKSNHPIVVVLIPVIAVLLWLPSLIGHNESLVLQPINYFNWPGYSAIVSVFKGNVFAMKIAALVLVILQAFYIIRLNFRHIFIESKTYLPAILFVMLASVFLPFQMLNPALLANVFVLIAIDIAFSQEHSSQLIKRYFESGFLIGIASLIYAPAVVCLILIWFAFSSLLVLRWRYVLSSTIGVIMPWLLLIAFQFIILKTIPALGVFDQFKYFVSPTTTFSWINLVAMSVMGLVIFVSLIRNAGSVGKRKISTRKYFVLLFWLMLMISLCIVFFKGIGFEIFMLAVIAVAVHTAMFFKEVRNKWIGELFFTILVLAIIVNQWF